MRSILVTNTKGGCGKTTIATNLAVAFAKGGFATALADVDRQKSSLGWLKTRPRTAAPIAGLDWRNEPGPLPDGVQRLVIDAPAGLRLKHVESLLREASLVVVPVLPSIFDERSTSRFLGKLAGIKPIAKGRKSVLLVVNRRRPRGRAGQRLVEHLAERDLAPAAELAERTLYAELAEDGLGVFDLTGRRVEAARGDWLPLLQAVERELA